jgi:hypothetical protein
MKNLRFLIITVVSILSLLSGRAFATDYEHAIRLPEFSFEWRLDGSNIHIRLSARTTGWVSIGFSPDGRMQGANLIIGYVNDGQVEIQDHFGIRGIQHIADVRNGGRDDVTRSGGNESAGLTTIWFTIPLESGDENDFPINPSEITNVLLAFGPDRKDVTSRHRYRTTLRVNLVDGTYR